MKLFFVFFSNSFVNSFFCRIFVAISIYTRMRRILLPLVSTALAFTPPAGDIYLSPQRGTDRGSGTSQAPFATLQRALKEAREWRRLNDGRIEGGIRILMEGGVYPLVKPVFIRPEDSGTPQSPTVICAVKGQEPIVSGGVGVGGWKPASADSRIPVAARGKLWVSEAPMMGNQVVPVAQMYVNGRKAERAKQFAGDRMERMVDFDKESETITIPTPAFPLDAAPQLQMLVHQRWAIALLRVREMRHRANGTTQVWFHQPESELEFAHPWPQPVIHGERGSSAFYLVNALELLDEPGEWYQDLPSGRIYYYPREGENMQQAQVVVPCLSLLVQLAGSRERPVSYLRFEHISFAHAAWTRPLFEGHVTLQGGFRLIDAYKLPQAGVFHKSQLENQAWIARPEAAIDAAFAHDITFENCVFKHVGATALDLRYAVRHARVWGCLFDDIGGTALMAGYFGEQGFETHIPYQPQVGNDLCAHLHIAGNTIHNTSNEDWGCAAVSAGYVSHTDILNNKVSHTNYSGICVGWGWTALKCGMQCNRIEGNTVSDYARRLYDAGGIYTLSNQPGSVIQRNTISAPHPAPYATNHRAFCIYFDEATDGFTVSENVMVKGSYGYNCPGPNLIVKDNIQ